MQLGSPFEQFVMRAYDKLRVQGSPTKHPRSLGRAAAMSIIKHRKPSLRRTTVSRVLIRPPTRADRDAILAMTGAARRVHPGLVPTPDALGKFLARIDGQRHVGLLVCLVDGGDLVGMINISEIIRGRFQSAFLGYHGNVLYADQGLMTEGLRLAAAHAFTKLKLHRVEANIQPANRRSSALVQRCGFSKEGFSPRYLKIGGRWRDHERWALTVEDWREARKKGRTRKSLN